MGTPAGVDYLLVYHPSDQDLGRCLSALEKYNRMCVDARDFIIRYDSWWHRLMLTIYWFIILQTKTWGGVCLHWKNIIECVLMQETSLSDMKGGDTCWCWLSTGLSSFRPRPGEVSVCTGKYRIMSIDRIKAKCSHNSCFFCEINSPLPIEYFKGSQVEFSKLCCFSVLEGCFKLRQRWRPWWNAALCCISSGYSLFDKKYLFRGYTKG